MGYEPVVNCRSCGEPLDVYQPFEDRYCSEDCQHEYDARLAIFEAIELSALHIRTDTKLVAQYAKAIVSMPTYETKAEGALQDAEEILTAGLLAVKLARSEIEKKRGTNGKTAA